MPEFVPDSPCAPLGPGQQDCDHPNVPSNSDHPATSSPGVSGPSSTSWPPAEQQPGSVVHRVFVGPAGLRAGWRFLVYCGLWFLLLGLFSSALAPLQSGKANTARNTIVAAAGMFGAALGAGGIMGIFEKRSPARYGLPLRGAFGIRFWEGALWGFGALSLLLMALHGTGDFGLGAPEIHGVFIVKYALLWGGAMLLVGFAEEYSFRGYPQFTLASGMGFWPAAVLLSAMFGSVHLFNPGETWVGGLNAGLIGFLFCFALRRTGSLWFPIGMHMAWNWGETFFYGVADSGVVSPGHLLQSQFAGSKWMTGGSVGPEGSLLAPILIGLMLLALHFRFRRS